MATGERGRRLGWIGGGIGALLWLLPVAGAAAWQRHWLAAGVGALGLLAGLLYVLWLRPWRFPATPFAVIYLGLVGIILLAAVTLLWLLAPDELGTLRRLALLSPLATLLIPAFIFGRRAWDELGPALVRRDDDGCA